MKRVFYDVSKKYSEIRQEIQKYCENDCDYDFLSEDNFLYDFDDGFVEFLNFENDYFVNVGFLESADVVGHCKEALADFLEKTKNIENLCIYSKVDSENKKAIHINSAMGFEQRYKIYEYKRD